MQHTAPIQWAERLEFVWKVHSYTCDWISTADTKAAFFFASYSAVLGAAYAAKLHHRFTQVAADHWQLAAFASILAFILLAAGIVCAFWALKPRLWNEKQTGLIFWENIQAHGTPSNFLNELKNTSCESLTEHVAHHTFMLGRIIHWKFIWVSWSAGLGLAGMVIGGAVLVFE
jgi:hypothetical protein